MPEANSKVCLFCLGTTRPIWISCHCSSCGSVLRSALVFSLDGKRKLTPPATQKVDWTSEQSCFSSFLRELAYFYTPGPLLEGEPEPNSSSSNSAKEQNAGDKVERWQVQHVIFPCLRRYLVAPKSLLDRDVVQVASLPDLYRVFERC